MLDTINASPVRQLAVLLAVLLLGAAVAAPAAANNAADRQQADVMDFSDGEEVFGNARLTRTDSGVGYNLRTTGLEKGHATSIWWVIFNHPEHCEAGHGAAACAMPDLFDEDVNAAVQAGGGNSVGQSGRSSYAGHLSIGETTNEHPLFLDGPGLINPRGAEIHLVVRTHGPVIEGQNHAMYNSYEVGCTPETSFDAGDGPNECADVQATVFEAPGE